ncbi:hypothetical protein DCCM_0784 [Desulfocucumis palustris]|uniref:Uncharacterized protein n=1 Tax=Desulfocucumis palustris TaxID=1898651 RepID=A0A2L2X8Z5_9FIRM|nr:hypothetical protein [Desulfocucumis palustris]GBF32588.1 hypothetical protein DCCM_0784 [Desulfocucumis palustris]
MERLELLRKNLNNSLILIKESVDASVILIKEGHKREVTGLWEDFLGTFIKYLRQKSKESGINLLASINFMRVWR